MSEIDEIKERIDIVSFINELYPLKKTGRNFTALCPFHSEKTPSFAVSPERQIWYCFGACNEGGDVIKFLMKWENLEFYDALKELAKKAGVKLSKLQVEDRNWKIKEKLYEINHLASEYYHYLLTKHKLGLKGLAYLKERNISDKIIKTFMLGYAPTGWRNLLSYLLNKGYHASDLVQAGLVIQAGEGKYYDRFRGRIIFTLFDERGNMIGFSGRILDKEAKEAKYINSPETAIYHKGRNLYGLNITKEAVRKKNQIIICEGEFDVLTSFQAGISNIAAVKGTALTSDQLRLIKRYTDEVVLAFDMDIAGDQASRRAIEMAEDFALNIKVVNLPFGKDLDETVRKDAALAAKAFNKTISIYDFIIASALSKYPANDPYSKKKIAADVIPFLSKVQNLIIKSHFVKKLADILDVSEEAVSLEIEKVKTRSSLPIKVSEFTQTNKSKNREETLLDYLLALIIQSKNPKENLNIVYNHIKLDDINKPAIRRILIHLRNLKNQFTEFDKILPLELLETYNKACLLNISGVLNEEKKYQFELIKVLSEIEKIILKRKLNEISTKISHTEDDKIVTDLNLEMKKILAKIQKLEKNEN